MSLFRRSAHNVGPMSPDELRRLREGRAEGLPWPTLVQRFGRSGPFLKQELAGVERRSPPGRTATELTPAQVVELGQAVAMGEGLESVSRRMGVNRSRLRRALRCGVSQ
jgi:hypothetical protein